MSIVKEVLNVIENEKHLASSKKISSSEVVIRYNDMLAKGIVKPRGNCLMPTSKLYTQNIIFNKKDK